MELPPQVWLVVVGAILVIVGVVVAPIDQPVGNASFWLGAIITAIGVIASVFFR